MSLADRLTVMREGVRNKILILDVERLPGITTQYWWDRGDLKNRYIHYETVQRHPRTTIVCAKWYDQAEVIELAEWDQGGRKRFLKNVHHLMAQADIIVGHNLDYADRGDSGLRPGADRADEDSAFAEPEVFREHGSPMRRGSRWRAGFGN